MRDRTFLPATGTAFSVDRSGDAATRIRIAVRAACAAFVGTYLAIGLLLAVGLHGSLDPAGSPLGYDFSAFHAAARLAWSGHPAAAYDDPTMIAAEQAAFPGTTARLPWNYPPTFLLALLPLAPLPYGWAWTIWSVSLAGAFAMLAARAFPRPLFWPILLSPVVAINLFLGQNGLLTTVLLGTGIALLPRRPIAAGLVLGAMSYKPHLAFLVPLVLIGGREWRALAASIASALALAVASAAVFGIGTWQAFLRKAGDAAAVASSSSSDWHAVPSTVVALKDLGVPDPYAGWIHAGVAALAATAALHVWARPAGRPWRAAILALAALIAAPYVRVYDFALLAFPIAALASPRRDTSWAEKVAAAVLWLTPAFLFVAGPAAPIGPLVVAVAMALIARRAAS